MRHVDGLYTQRFNRRHRRDGTLFRGRYKAILVDADEYLAAVVRYTHLKAVEAGLARMPEDYPWVRIPNQIGHPFRCKSATRSGVNRPPFRSIPATPYRGT